MQRFFIKRQQLKNNIISLDEDQSKKIRKVLRLKKGDIINVLDNNGWEYEAQLEKIASDFSVARVVNQHLHEKDSNVIILQALPKNLKVEFIIQKCTELGVDKIIFFSSKFSQVVASRISEEKIKRWRKIASQAAEQSRRVFAPDIELSLENLESLLDTYKDNNIYYLDQTGKWITDLNPKVDKKNITIFIGPEGGFSSEELEMLSNQKIKKIKVAENILRTETAGLSFLSQLVLIK